ncbi:NUDIX hydrolase [Methylovirgula sp. 4M-Z18]|uniref:NUDIX hydrolase n=1 Tax=Methylovirgula sp. 4M-Z18 TaxID=2293567 RepID=UPI000E2FC13D|nr:NUDIX hydrolase [Methylovirgula sp. 4M-Z18]RFB80670.1 NUDIX hydrolase [Methylovirgula sp. 4M-Z18]
MTDFAQKLTETERERRWPNVKPRDAATLIILDRTGTVPKVLMGKRHMGHKFMPRKFVFPGGGIEPGDRRMNVAGPLAEVVEAKLMARNARGTAARARALGLAAIRETFEETGILIGVDDMGTPENPPEGAWAAFAAHGVYPALDRLHFIARAITPPRRPKRFDAAFFAVDMGEIVGRVEGIVHEDAELTELVWVPIDEAQKLELPTITSVVLQELEARLVAGFGHFLPVPFYYERNRTWVREEL